MYKYLLILGIVFFSTSCKAQVKGDIENIKKEVANYLLEKKEIKDLEKVEKRVFIVEIIDNKILGFNDKGIYRIGTYSSPSATYILLKNNESFEIIDLIDFKATLKRITTFLTTNDFSDIKITAYLDKIIDIYRSNAYDAKVKF